MQMLLFQEIFAIWSGEYNRFLLLCGVLCVMMASGKGM